MSERIPGDRCSAGRTHVKRGDSNKGVQNVSGLPMDSGVHSSLNGLFWAEADGL